MHTEKRERYLLAFFLVAGLGLALAGQYLIATQREQGSKGLALLLAGGLLVLVTLVLERTDARIVARIRHGWQGRGRRLLVVALAAGVVAWAVYLAHVQASRYALLVWMVGVLVGVGELGGLFRAPTRPKGSRREVMLVALLAAAALASRLVGLGGIPAPLSGDEGSMALEAHKVLAGIWISPFGTGWFSHPNFYFYLLAASLRLFGGGVFALRLPAAFLGASGVVAVYLLARGLFGRATAWVAALFVLGWSLTLHFSRMALNNSADVFFGAVVMAFLHRGVVTGRRWAFSVAGLALGLSLHFYFGSRLLLLLVPLAIALGGWRRVVHRRWGLAVMVGVTLLVAAPLIVHYLRYPDDFIARAATDGLFQTGELEMEHLVTGRPIPLLWLEHVGRSAAAFVYTLDQGYFYTDTAPMLQWISGALFVLGVELAVLRMRQPRYAGLLAWIVVVVLVNGGLVSSPPGYHRYMIAAPAVAILLGRVAVVIVRRVASLHPSPLAQRALVVGTALLVAFSGIYYYFAVYVPSGNYADRNTEIADRAARLMAGVGPPARVYFLGDPLVQLRAFNSVRFLAPDVEWVDVPAGLPDGWEWTAPDRPRLFLALPERAAGLAVIQDRCPGGEFRVVTSAYDPTSVLFSTYLLPAGTTCLAGVEAPS
jgi:4-amino-4-deoxy-L-arabinose transferase-like glycosyltransferase